MSGIKKKNNNNNNHHPKQCRYLSCASDVSHTKSVQILIVQEDSYNNDDNVDKDDNDGNVGNDNDDRNKDGQGGRLIGSGNNNTTNSNNDATNNNDNDNNYNSTHNSTHNSTKQTSSNIRPKKKVKLFSINANDYENHECNTSANMNDDTITTTTNNNNDNDNDNQSRNKKRRLKKKKKRANRTPTIISTFKLPTSTTAATNAASTIPCTKLITTKEAMERSEAKSNYLNMNKDNVTTNNNNNNGNESNYNNNNMMMMNGENCNFSDNHKTRIQIHVKPLLVLDINGILCHRIRNGDVPSLLLSKLIQLDKAKKEQRTNPNSGSSGDSSGSGSGSGSGNNYYYDNDIEALLPTTFGKESDVERNKRLCRSIYRKAIGHVAGTPIVVRTDLIQYLSFLDEHFTLAIWSSAKKKTVNSLVKLLFPEHIAAKLLFVWGQNRCECVLDTKVKSNNHYRPSEIKSPLDSVTHRKSHHMGQIFVKPLSKVWGQYLLWDKSNTLLIDDSPDKCPVKYQNNSLHPPPLLGLDVSTLLSRVRKEEKDGMEHSQNGTCPHEDFDNLFSDQLNEEKQRIFFERLVKHNEYNLQASLSAYGKDHMGWRG